MYHRVMGVDYGDKRVGVALSDPLKIIASAFEVVQNKSQSGVIDRLLEIIREYDVDEIVMGLPLQMDGEIGDRALLHKQFGEMLSNASGIEVKYLDERLTSVEAEEILIEGGVSRDKRKGLIDKVAAQIILQSYLDN